MNVTPLQWDSDFFGIRIGKADIKTENDIIFLIENSLLLKNQFDLVYLFSEDQYENERWTLVDQKVTLFDTTEKTTKTSLLNVVPYCGKTVTNDLLNLALISGEHSRYKKDLRFPELSYERLYSKWIENSVNRTIADVILCYYEGKEIKGMVTVRIVNKIGQVGLFAVSPECQNKGIGTALYIATVEWLRNRNINYLQIATQATNQQGMNFYKRNNMTVYSITNIYHWWL